MKKLRYATSAIGVIAIALFIFARELGVEEWRWAFFAVGTLCAIVVMFADYKERKGIFADGYSNAIGVIYVVSMLLLLTSCVIHFATGGEAVVLVSAALLIYLGVLVWFGFRRKSNDCE